MSLQYSVAVRNAQNDAFEATVGVSAKLQIRSGAAPANCAAAAAGVLLAELTLPSDWMGASASGVKALAGSWTGTAIATGTAQHWRIVDNAGTTCHAQGTLTATGGGGDLEVTSTTVTSGDTVEVDTFSITRGNA